ncbi:N-acetylmuramoyl-L-alanine amidase [Halopseudomonas xinjiangensis]|uniref:N-acetylmuramoyl-L-alanine amidase n=1 Tax=Halopseudomonas xinjiangensis TaxID=487184 RepID=A0A1H1Y493_9GAMM|nr:N-acetylmuramoyl-L-alanine amidase [Halopseudomonas xinjiangensis]
MKLLVNSLLVMLFLTGCASGPAIDTRYSSESQDSRVQYVVLHYTSSGFERSLGTLTRGPVSSHYLIKQSPPTIYRLVDESRRAWHAGDSSWQGRTWLNATSIGIELVHPGYSETPLGRVWHTWEPRQIQALTELLADILERHNLTPDRVVGHSDVAPQRKLDPGPLFPWQQLADAGVAIWPDQQQVQSHLNELRDRTPPLRWFRQSLATFGYALPEDIDTDRGSPALRNVIAAFQMRFRPARYDGLPDSETAALLAALVPAAVSWPDWCAPADAPREADPCQAPPAALE